MPRDSKPNYFAINTTGWGYLNNLRWVENNGSEFLAGEITTYQGYSGGPDNLEPRKYYYDVTVRGEDITQLLTDLMAETSEDDQIWVKYEVEGLYASPFEYTKGDRAGEIGLNHKGALTWCEYISVNKNVFHEGVKPQQESEQSSGSGRSSAKGKGNNQSRGNATSQGYKQSRSNSSGRGNNQRSGKFNRQASRGNSSSQRAYGAAGNNR